MTDRSRTVRIFLSSTFRDFGEERDLLVRQVFPALRARLKERFVELIDVDLRWGITPKQAERGEVLPICLNEIDRARPYFIGMLGERYGWIPAAEGYAPELLESQPWLKDHQGGKSVTELEILHGVLNNRHMQGRAFFYFRSPAYAQPRGKDYLPASREDQARQRELKRRIRASGLPVVAYADPQALARRIERDLRKLLDDEFPASQVPDAFELERLRHVACAVPRRRLYLRVDREYLALERRLTEGAPRILVEGPCGSGKSALLANFFHDWRGRHPRHVLFEHDLSASAEAPDPHALVRRLVESIQRQTRSRREVPDDPQALVDSLPSWLATASAWARRRGTRWILVIDGLDALIEQTDLRWWPAFIPEGITVVVSCQPGPVMQALQAHAPWQVVTIRPLARMLSSELLTTYLARFNKKLPPAMVRQAQAHPLAGNPLFIRTLAEEMRLFGVHERLKDRLDHYLGSHTLDDLFERVLERVEADCGRQALRITLTALWASRAGLTEKEILAIAGLPPAKWAAIRLALDDALTEIGGCIRLAQEPVRVAVRDRYLPHPRSQRQAHRHLARWFGSQSPDARRAQEEAWQWHAAQDWKRLLHCLSDREGLMAMHEHQGVNELMVFWLKAESALKLRMEDVLHTCWRKWVRTMDARTQRLTSDVLVDLLHHAGRLTPLTLHLARRGLELARCDPRVPRHELASYIDMLAILYKDMGHYTRAQPLYLEALALARRLPPARRESLAYRLNNLAVFYKNTDRIAQAEAMYREALVISQRLSGTHSESVAITRVNLASLLRQSGRLAEALTCADRAVAMLTRLHGQDDPGLITALNNRAKVLESMRREGEALESLRQALSLGRRLLGDPHLTVALVKNNMANLLDDEDPQEATRLASEALQARRAILPAQHPDIGASLEVLGSCARERGDPQAAIACYTEALSIYRALGLRSDEAGAHNHLGLIAHDAGDLREAERNYRMALKLLEGIGHGRSRQAVTLTNNLAMALKELGDLPGALEMAQRVMRLRQSLYAEFPVRVATATHNVASILEAMGRRSQALHLYRRALQRLEQALGTSHKELLDTLVNMGTLMAEGRQARAGILLLERARRIARTRLGDTHRKTGVILYHLGSALGSLGAIDRAVPILREEIRIAEKHEGIDSESVRLSLRHLGVLLRDHGRPEEAEPLLLRALAIARKRHGRQGFETASELNALGKLRQNQGRLKSAQTLLEACLRLRQSDPDADEDDIRRVQERLASVHAQRTAVRRT